MLDAMKKDGSVDKDVLQKVGDAPSDVTLLTADQATKAGTQIASLWPAAMG
jgi:putative spermidine/putrescine transport system substrate-binding protein